MEYDSVGNLTRFVQQVGGLSNGTEMSNAYTYENDRIVSITHNGFSYNFTYDEWGNRTSIKINETEIVTSSYDENSRLTSVSYANGQSVSYAYNDNGSIRGVSFDGGETLEYEYTYSESGTLTSCIDRNSGFVTIYDETKTEMRDLSTNSLIYSTSSNNDGSRNQTVFNKTIVYEYDSDSNQTTGKTTSSISFNDTFTTKKNDETVTAQLDYINTVTKDWFDRTESKSFTSALTLSDGTSSTVNGQYGYTYDDTADTASPRILSHSSSFTNGSTDISRTDGYEYDDRGNITGIFRTENGEKVYHYSYEYDEANQVTRENNLDYNCTIVYVYDKGGNMTQKTSYTYTLGDITPETAVKNKAVYVYSDPVWKDKLTSFEYTDYEDSSNSFVSAVEYDNAGNITYFNGSHYTWTAGRQLKSVTDSDGIRIDYTYNENGFMTTQTEYKNGEYESTAVYIWDSDTLVERRFYNKNDPESFTSSRIVYDSDGEPQALVVTSGRNGIFSGEVGELVLYYRRNLQGDITGLVDAEGRPMGEFVYDAFGNFTFETETEGIGAVFEMLISFALTPISYRGYVYTSLDSKHCYYYLGSRFYSPLLSRFMNADSMADTGTGVVGTNMFAYCNNNPVLLTDPKGESFLATAATLMSIVLLSVAWAIVLSLVIPRINNEFQRLFPEIVKSITERIVNGDRSFIKQNPSILSFLKMMAFLTARTIYNAIYDVYVDAKKHKSHSSEKHHIVAKSDSRAATGRNILKIAGLSVEDDYNLVFVKYSMHRRLHTSDYHYSVGTFLTDCKNRGKGDYKEIRQNVINGLYVIKFVIKAFNFSMP